jgi:hypothetical protein
MKKVFNMLIQKTLYAAKIFTLLTVVILLLCHYSIYVLITVFMEQIIQGEKNAQVNKFAECTFYILILCG